MKSLITRLTLFCLLACVTTPALADLHGRYLPEAPFELGSGATVSSYGGNLTEFTEDVECEPWGTIGQIKFTYDTWTGSDPPPDPVRAIGGAGLVGGFYGDCPVELKPGYEWGWVQTVTATIPGDNVWGADPDEEFPDTKDTLDPDYPNTIVSWLDPAPTVGFQDFPWRLFEDGDQYWLAELGLVCKNHTEKKVCIVDTFLWGFGVEDDPAAITPNPPSLWGDPTQSYLDTLRNCFDGDPGTAWEFCDECCCCIPEPATLLLLAFGGLILARRRRR